MVTIASAGQFNDILLLQKIQTSRIRVASLGAFVRSCSIIHGSAFRHTVDFHRQNSKSRFIRFTTRVTSQSEPAQTSNEASGTSSEPEPAKPKRKPRKPKSEATGEASAKPKSRKKKVAKEEVTSSAQPTGSEPEMDKWARGIQAVKPSWTPSDSQLPGVAVSEELPAGTSSTTLQWSDYGIAFLQAVMERARDGDSEGAELAIADMALAGLSPGARAYHGLILAYTRAGDVFGAVDALQRLLQTGHKVELATMTAVARACGDHRQVEMGESLIGLMEKLQLSPRMAWCHLIERLWHAGETSAANRIFLKGMRAGPAGSFVATDDLIALLLEGNARLGDLGTSRDIFDVIQVAGKVPTSFHFNCLFMAQHQVGQFPLMLQLHEMMLYADIDGLKPMRESLRPDVDTYNWMLSAYAKEDTCFGDSFAEFVNEMVNAHKRIQPNALTYARLTQICVRSLDHWDVAMMYFRALIRQPGWLPLYASLDHKQEANPLQQLIRILTMIREIPYLALVLEEMVQEGVAFPQGAFRVDSKSRRTFVSNWIEPLDVEPNYGAPVDYIQRWNEEKGPDAIKSRYDVWVDQKFDYEGFWEHGALSRHHISYREKCYQESDDFFKRALYVSLVDPESNSLSDLTPEQFGMLVFHCFKMSNWYRIQKSQNTRRISGMLVSELKAELEAQGLPTDGRRSDLVARVERAREAQKLIGGDPLEFSVEKPDEEIPQEVLDQMASLSLRRLYRSAQEAQEDFLKDEDKIPTVLDLWEQCDRHFEETKEQLRKDAAQSSLVKKEKEEKEYLRMVAKAAKTGLEDTTEEVEEEEEEREDVVAGFKEIDQLLGDKVSLANAQPVKLKGETKEEKLLRNVLEWEAEMKSIHGRAFLWSLDEKKPLREQIEIEFADADVDIVTAWQMHWEEEFRARAPPLYTEKGEIDLAMRIFRAVRALGSYPTVSDTVFLIRRSVVVRAYEHLLPLIESANDMQYRLHTNLYQDVITACLKNGRVQEVEAISAFLIENNLLTEGALPISVPSEDMS